MAFGSVYMACDTKIEDIDKLKEYRKFWARFEGSKKKEIKKEAVKRVKSATLLIKFFEGDIADYKNWNEELHSYLKDALYFTFDNKDISVYQYIVEDESMDDAEYREMVKFLKEL